jgi:hypothetical protein
MEAGKKTVLAHADVEAKPPTMFTLWCLLAGDYWDEYGFAIYMACGISWCLWFLIRDKYNKIDIFGERYDRY